MAKKKPEKDAAVAVEYADAKTETSIVSKEKAETAVVLTDDTAAAKKAKKTGAKKQSDKPNIFKRMWKGIKGILSELKKVTWPKGKDVLKSTAVVLVVVVAFFVILFIIDYVLAGLLSLIVNGEWAYVFIS